MLDSPVLCCIQIYTLQAIRAAETSKGRRLTVQEKRELLRNPVKLLQTLLPALGTLYSGLQPAAIETTASNAVSGCNSRTHTHEYLLLARVMCAAVSSGAASKSAA